MVFTGTQTGYNCAWKDLSHIDFKYTCTQIHAVFMQIAPRWFRAVPGWVHIVPRWVLKVLGWIFVKFLFSPNFYIFCRCQQHPLGDLHVQQALAMVAAEEAYTEVLQLKFKPMEEGDGQPTQLQAPGTNAVLEAAIIKAKEKYVEGDPPPSFPEQCNYSTHASTCLCLDNQEQYSRVSHYINSRGQFNCVPVGFLKSEAQFVGFGTSLGFLQ